MTLYTVEFSNEAWNAIEAQVRFIAEQNLAPLNASRWVKRLLAEITTLENLPGRSPVDQQQSQIHGVKVHRLLFERTERTYFIFYTIDDEKKCVNVVSFSHGARHAN